MPTGVWSWINPVVNWQTWHSIANLSPSLIVFRSPCQQGPPGHQVNWDACSAHGHSSGAPAGSLSLTINSLWPYSECHQVLTQRGQPFNKILTSIYSPLEAITLHGAEGVLENDINSQATTLSGAIGRRKGAVKGPFPRISKLIKHFDPHFVPFHPHQPRT